LVNKSKEIIKAENSGSLTTMSFTEQQWTLSNTPVFIDNENITWVCTEGSGVIKLISTGFHAVQSTPGASKRSIIHSSLYGSDTTWYLMNNNSLVRKINNDYKEFAANISSNFFWIGQHNNYLIIGNGTSIYSAKIPVSGKTKVFFHLEFTMPGGLSMGSRSFIDPYGNIIFCSNQLLVLHRNKIINKQPVQPADVIEGITTDAVKRIWVLTRYSGIKVFTEHPDDPANYLQEFLSFKNEFINISPRCMLLDEKKHIIWVGTRYQGIISFLIAGNRLKKIQQFQTGQGLTDNFVTALACDSTGNIIVGTQAGLDRLIVSTPGKYRIENITKNNNIFDFIGNLWVNSRNETYALTNTGILYQLLPFQLKHEEYEPNLFIEEVTVNGEQVQQGVSHLRFPYKSQNITFNIAAPTYIDEKQVLYSYQLTSNNNGAWSEPTSNASINLLNLSPGEYTLNVKATFRSTAYASKELSSHFVISPPWWQSWWFRMLAGLIVFCLLVITIRIYYLRKLKKKFAILEKQQAIEKERTRIATDMHDDLGAGLSTIRFLSEKVKRNSFSEITKIDADKIVINSNELVQKMNEIIWAMNEKNDTLEDLLFYTRSYAVEYCEENSLSCETYLPETVPHVFVSGEIRRNVFLTVKESLHNIVKHANAKKVIIDFKINATLLVMIKDDGKGLSENGKTNGNGLRNMQKRIESVNGIFEIVNSNGVIVKMKVPL
jgi:signal transduction histidine kinase